MARGKARGWAVPVIALALAGGCYRGTDTAQADGSAGDGSGSDGGLSGGGTAGDGGDSPCQADLSVSPLRRLSAAQYRNTLADLFAPAGIDVPTEAADELDRIPTDDAGSTFGILDARVSDQHAHAYYRLADTVAGLVVEDDTRLAAVAGDCAVQPDADDACVDAFLDDFAMRAYRRPLASDERERLHAVAAGAPDNVEMFRSLVFVVLMAPPFLYHVELEGDGDDVEYALDGYALASRLSYHFWQTMPDDELFAAAADGSLLTDEGYLAQLDRIVDDPRTGDWVDRFYDEWLQLGWLTVWPDTPAFATFAEGTTIGYPDADHLVAAQEEIHALARRFTFEQEGTLADLLLTDVSLTTSPHLAELYGVEPWDGTSEPPRMPDGERSGLLTRVGFLLTGNEESHPVHRGSAIRGRILCQELSPPDPTTLPPGALDQPPVSPDQTTRQRYEAKTADAVCQGCHQLINPPGFVLEQYDAIGRYRTEERVMDESTGEVLAVLPVDASAAAGLDGSDTVISDPAALGQQVLDSGQAEACFSRQYFRATFGREESDADTCSIGQVEDALVDGSLHEALRAIALEPVFRTRRVQVIFEPKTRRMFLRSAGGLALGLPFLPSLLPRSVKAGTSSGPRRLVAIQSQSGQMVDDFFPAWTPAGYQLRDAAYGGLRADGTTALHTTMPGTSATWAPLADFTAQDLSKVLPSTLQPFFDKMLLLRGIDYLQGTSHGTGMMLGNYANCASGSEFEARGLGPMPTIDQVLAYSDAFYPTPPLKRSLVLATGSPGSISDTDYGVAGGPVENVPAYLEPHDLWQDLFGDFMEPDMPMENPNRRLVNAVYEDYAQLAKHSRLSADDKATLERHMTFLDDIERELEQGVAAGCTKPDEPPVYGVGYPWQEVSSVADFEAWTGLLVDIAVAALRCDMTRIVTFQAQMGITDVSGMPINSYHNSADIAGDWHDYAHDAADTSSSRANIVALNRWVVAAVFQRFLEQLDVEESDGATYLDNSLVYWGGELSMDHYVIGMPTILAGSAGGALSTGHYVDYSQMGNDYANPILPWGVLIPGVPHNRLLVTILQAMGLAPGDYERDGRPGYGHTEMFYGPYNWPEDAYVTADIGKPLPGIWMG